MHNLLFCMHTQSKYGTKHFFWLALQTEVNNYSVLCTVKAKKANKNIQRRTLLDFITIPVYTTSCTRGKDMVRRKEKQTKHSKKSHLICGKEYLIINELDQPADF